MPIYIGHRNCDQLQLDNVYGDHRISSMYN